MFNIFSFFPRLYFSIDPVIGAALIGGGASLFGSGLNFFSARSAQAGQSAANREQQAFNAREAEKNRAFQQTFFNTRYQNTRKDLEAAGYNPIMALGGSPGNVPGGSAASATPQSTTSQSSLIKAAIAKIASETFYNVSSAMTESSKQKQLDAQTKLLGGRVSVPGFYSGPAESAAGVKRLFDQAPHAWKALKNYLYRGTFADN